MIKFTPIFFLLLSNINLFAQTNLVPNYSFEDYSTCPTGFGAICNATPWFQPNDGATYPCGSSDAFNVCNGQIPYNISYYQFPRTGDGYAGIELFFGPGFNEDKWREYIEVGLTDSLKLNKKYCIRFFVNKGNNSGYPIKQIQAVLTNDSLLYYDPEFKFITGVTPILEADSIITDTLNWLPIQTTYTAIGGEQFLTIGNFNPGALVDYLYTWPYGSGSNSLGYYVFDDVSVYELPDYNAGIDTTICPWHSTIIGPQNVRADVQYSWSPTAGLDNPNIANPTASPLVNMTYILTVTDTCQWACNSILMDTINITVTGCVGIDEFKVQGLKFNVYPNPANEKITIETNIMNSNLSLIDVSGRVIQQIKINQPKTEIQLNNLADGLYYLMYKNKTQKLVIQK